MSDAMRSGYFVTFEGIEGVGKSTQLALAAGRARSEGWIVRTTREPGGTPLAERIRDLVLGKHDEPVTAATELLLMTGARAQHVAHCLRPALAAGEVVLCDRYCDATYAYQGGGRGVERRLIEPLIELSTDGLLPDLTFLFDAPAAIALGRARSRQGATDRIEAEALDFFERVRAVYLSRARAEPDRFRVIDAAEDVARVAARVERELLALIRGARA